jgi:hypothetical protein
MELVIACRLCKPEISFNAIVRHPPPHFRGSQDHEQEQLLAFSTQRSFVLALRLDCVRQF